MKGTLCYRLLYVIPHCHWIVDPFLSLTVLNIGINALCSELTLDSTVWFDKTLHALINVRASHCSVLTLDSMGWFDKTLHALINVRALHCLPRSPFKEFVSQENYSKMFDSICGIYVHSNGWSIVMANSALCYLCGEDRCKTNLSQYYLPPVKEVGGKVMVLHLSVILSPEGMASLYDGTSCLAACFHLPSGGVPMYGGIYDRDLLASSCGHWSGRYASHWNAFLFYVYIVTFKQ